MDAKFYEMFLIEFARQRCRQQTCRRATLICVLSGNDDICECFKVILIKGVGVRIETWESEYNAGKQLTCFEEHAGEKVIEGKIMRANHEIFTGRFVRKRINTKTSAFTIWS